MIRQQQKRHYRGCGVSIRPQPAFIYPKGHPCHGCPYTFGTAAPSCSTGDRPGDCVWYFYRGLLERSGSPQVPACTAAGAVEGCIENLYRVAERKFGRRYAKQLRQRRFPSR